MSQRPRVQPAPSSSSPGSGGRLVATAGRPLPLIGAALRVEARGGLARVVLEQRFRNPHPEPLHVIYLLPLPVDGAVSGFGFRVGERRVVGEVDRRAAARERFEEAILEGRTAALLEQDRSSLFTQELGNIPPGAEVLAELTIDQRLRWLDVGAWEWRFPTVVAPRYLGAEGRVADASRVTVDVAETSLPVRVALSCLIRDAVVSGRAPESPSHGIRVGKRDDGLEVGLVEGAALDRDLVVRWPVATPVVGLALDTGRPPAGTSHGDVAYGLLTLVPPAHAEGERAFPRDLVVLLDTSGSMGGPPLAQARAVVTALVESLGEADRLELIAFADQPRRWRRNPVAAAASARTDARRWLDALQASGGTEMRAGIAEALRPLRADAQRQVVLVTDGQIGFEQEIVAVVARDLPSGSRLHTIGVGSSLNRSLTAPAARAGRGVEVVIGLDEEPAEAARQLVARTRAPLLTDLVVEGSALLGYAPARVPDLMAAGPALVSIQLRSKGGSLRVRGRTPVGAWEVAVDVPALDAGKGSAAVVTLYGREAVEDLELRAACGERSVDAEIERLGLRFQIATRRTSWVAVSEEPAVDPRQPTRRERMPHELPAGMSVEGLGLRGATPIVVRQQMARSKEAMLLGRAGDIMALRDSSESPPACPPEFSADADVASSLRTEQFYGPTEMTGRLVRRRDRELVVEIFLDRPVDWRPVAAEVRWADGTRLEATIDARSTTERGWLERGLVARVVLRLDADGPPDPPSTIVVHGGRVSLPVTLTTR
jgi:Ca-activated chloride channel homolog